MLISQASKLYIIAHCYSPNLDIAGAGFVQLLQLLSFLDLLIQHEHLRSSLSSSLAAAWMPLLCATGKRCKGRKCQDTTEIQRYIPCLAGLYQPLIHPLSSSNMLSLPGYEWLLSKQISPVSFKEKVAGQMLVGLQGVV